jgi:lactate oxidase
VEFIQKASGLPVLLKGVLTPQLAVEGITRGAAGIQVSNHGSTPCRRPSMRWGPSAMR